MGPQSGRACPIVPSRWRRGGACVGALVAGTGGLWKLGKQGGPGIRVFLFARAELVVMNQRTALSRLRTPGHGGPGVCLWKLQDAPRLGQQRVHVFFRALQKYGGSGGPGRSITSAKWWKRRRSSVAALECTFLVGGEWFSRDRADTKEVFKKPGETAPPLHGK